MYMYMYMYVLLPAILGPRARDKLHVSSLSLSLSLSLFPPSLISSHLLGLLDRLCFGDEDGDGRGEPEGEEPSLDLSPPSFGLPCLLLPRPLFRSIAAALGLADLTLGDRSKMKEREK